MADTEDGKTSLPDIASVISMTRQAHQEREGGT